MTGDSASGQHKATNENHKGGQPRLDPPEVAQPIEQGPQYQNNTTSPRPTFTGPPVSKVANIILPNKVAR